MRDSAPPRGGALLPIASLAALILITLLALARDYPLVGHDYRYFLPRILDTDLHIRLNGLGVQWFTPSFGGGLPAFPNPQHTQYSLLQAAAHVMNPWTAVLVTTGVVAAIGYLALYRSLSRTFGLAPVAAALGAACFAGNGFFIEHLIVGHLGFQLFPLGAVMFDAMTDTRRPSVANGALSALVAAAMLHQAGFYLLIISTLSLGLSLLVVEVVRPELSQPRRLSVAAGVALGLGALMTAAKIGAVLSLLRQFPRAIADVYDVGLAQAAVGFFAQLFGVMTISPLVLMSGGDVTDVSDALWKLTGADVRVGVWELDAGLSPVVLIALAAGAWRLASETRASGRPRVARRRAVAIGLLAVAVWAVLEMTLARGVLYPFMKALPVASSLHVNHRFAAAFILPLTVLAALAADRWMATATRGRNRIGPILLALATASPLVYLAFPARIHQRAFDVTSTLAASARIRAGEPLPIDRIAAVDDPDALGTGASSQRPYEPLFGYELETFAAETWVGGVHEIRNGAFNMTHAASLVYPDLNGVAPFARIRVADRDALDTFVGHGRPPWRVPALQQSLGWVALLGLAFSLGLVIVSMGLRRP